MMNRRFKDFLLLTVLARVFDGIVVFTGLIRRLLLKLAVLAFLGLSIQVGIYYFRDGNLAAVMENFKMLASTAGLLCIFAFATIQPLLSPAFIWVLKKAYKEEHEEKSIG